MTFLLPIFHFLAIFCQLLRVIAANYCMYLNVYEDDAPCHLTASKKIVEDV